MSSGLIKGTYMGMEKATQDVLNALHSDLANYFSERLLSGEPMPAGELSAINAFLKNNNITSDLLTAEPLQDLLKEFTESKEKFIKDVTDRVQT